VAQLIALAKRLDPGLSDRDFADAGRQLDRMPDGVFARYGLDAATVATLRERFAAWPRACVPGQSQCDSYDEAHWLGFTPLRITSVTFAGGAHAKKWAVVSDYGGTAEVNDPPSRSAPRTAARSASTRGTRSTGRLMPSPTARTTRAPGSTTARPTSSRPRHNAAARSGPTPPTASRSSNQYHWGTRTSGRPRYRWSARACHGLSGPSVSPR